MRIVKISERNLHAHELLGLYVECIEPFSKVRHSGYVYNETKNQLWIKTSKGIKKLLKKSYIFIFNINGVAVKIKGQTILGNPEERIKKI